MVAVRLSAIKMEQIAGDRFTTAIPAEILGRHLITNETHLQQRFKDPNETTYSAYRISCFMSQQMNEAIGRNFER